MSRFMHSSHGMHGQTVLFKGKANGTSMVQLISKNIYTVEQGVYLHENYARS